jgi:hypothetical protein
LRVKSAAGKEVGSGAAGRIEGVTTREKAERVLKEIPEERVPAALAALEAVEGKETSVEAILARHGERRLTGEEYGRSFGSLPSDEEG